ncbi:MAG TPA: prepilin peptidase [Paenalcaligenes sp.]|nr:prepilin peptidase [Paenalcaligenes sp.]
MNLSDFNLLLTLALLVGGAYFGERYARCYRARVSSGASVNAATALSCAAEVMSSRSGFRWRLHGSTVGLLLGLAIAVVGQSSIVQQWLLVILLPVATALWRIDRHLYVLPDALVACVAVLGGAYAYSQALLGAHVLVAVAVYVVLQGVCWLYEALTGRASMGAGDTKLIAALMLWLGLQWLLLFLGLAAVIVLAMNWRRLTSAPVVPFGPPLLFAAVVLLAVQAWA